MSATIVVGVNWGDEGKGRIVDYLATNADVVVRYQGGNNAGHTVVNQFGTFRMHLIPSGIFNSRVMNVLGNGMVIHLEALCDEMNQLAKAGVDVSGIRVAERALICFPFHCQEDAWEEERLGAGAFGSTKRGIAPCYGDWHMKRGIQLGEMFYPDVFRRRLRCLIDTKNLIVEGLYGRKSAFDYEQTLEWASVHFDRIKHLVCDTITLVGDALQRGERVLFEAQLGALRDVYTGIYPSTSSSCSLAAFARVGGGPIGSLGEHVIGVMKAFSTCVGAGPFVAEMCDAEAADLREIAHEYGAATGRPRRIGHFDAVASRYGAWIQGATEIALTKLDCLSGRHPLRICTAYKIGNRMVDRFPLTPGLEVAQPVYTEMQGWTEDITGCRRFEDLPQAAAEYVKRLEASVGVPIGYISVGPERSSIIVCNG